MTKTTTVGSKRIWVVALIAVVIIAVVVGGAYYFLMLPAAPKEIRIAVIAPATGSEAWIGIDSWRGARIAAEEINKAGGINGLNVTIYEYDDADNPAETVSMSRRAIYSDGVVAGVLASGSDTCLSGASAWNDAKKPMVVAWAGHPDITKGAGWVYRVAPIADVIGRGLATYAYKNLTARTVGTIATDDAYEISVKEKFVEEFKNLGGSHIYDKIVEWGEKSYETLLTELKTKNADVILMPGDYTMSIPFTTQARGLGITVPLLPLGPSSTVQQFIDGVGEGGGQIVLDSYGDITMPAVIAFEQKYVERYKAPSTFGTWLTYDSVKVLAEAIKKHGTAPDQIKQGLSETKDFVGLAGKVASFTAGGECLRNVILLGIQKDPSGKLVFFKKAEVTAQPSWVPR